MEEHEHLRSTVYSNARRSYLESGPCDDAAHAEVRQVESQELGLSVNVK